MQHTLWDEARLHDIIARHAGREGPLLPILHDLQEAFGCVPRDAVPLVAAALNLSRAEVHGVVTFYHDFRQIPAGRHVVKLCRAEACQSMGAEAVAEAVRRHLAIGFGDTSADHHVTLEPVYCLGLCACAPAAIIDGEVVGRLTPQSVTAVLQDKVAP